jgi:aminoglycoside phosphotransferase family enzyme/predicted kinase
MVLPWHIEGLLEARAYPPPSPPETITLSQTHISYLLFTPEFVYKIKKPVDFGFLDFTTLEKRRHFCFEEVRLNRRLAPDVYLGVVEITSRDGRVYMEGTGETIEYAVKMRRLRPETILEEMLKIDTVTEETIEGIAETIADFHKGAETNEKISGFGTPEVIKRNIDENFSQTTAFISGIISQALFDSIRGYTEGFIAEKKKLFLRRVDKGFIRDCHGDIHCEHISIGERINIIDCIEFNERFRFSDVVADIAFLSMDLDFHNRSDLAKKLDRAYFRASGDRGGTELMNFYKSYRAYIRGKVEGFKYLEPEVPEVERQAACINARHHFHLAGQYARGGFRPMMIIICGLSSTGKSTLARALGDATNAKVLSSDAVRKELAGLDAGTHRFEGFEEGIYSDEFSEKTYSALIERGSMYIRSGRTCVLDATFSKNRFLESARAHAEGAGLTPGLFHVFECTARDTTVKKRLRERLQKEKLQPGAAVSDISWDLYLKQKAAYEEILEPHIKIDSALGPAKGLKTVTDKIFG